MLPSRWTASPLMIAGCAPGAITTAVCCASGAVGDWRLHPETTTSTARAAASASACEWPRAITLRPGEPANMTASERGGQDRRARAGGRPHGDMEGGTGGGKRAPSRSTVVADGMCDATHFDRVLGPHVYLGLGESGRRWRPSTRV